MNSDDIGLVITVLQAEANQCRLRSPPPPPSSSSPPFLDFLASSPSPVPLECVPPGFDVSGDGDALTPGIVPHPLNPTLDLFHVRVGAASDVSQLRGVNVMAFSDGGCSASLLSPRLRDVFTQLGSIDPVPAQATKALLADGKTFNVCPSLGLSFLSSQASLQSSHPLWRS
jgi:hypothetical protein